LHCISNVFRLPLEIKFSTFVTEPLLKTLILHAKSDKKEINIPALSCIAQISSSSEEFGIKLINGAATEASSRWIA